MSGSVVRMEGPRSHPQPLTRDSLDLYFRELESAALLSPEQEIEVATRIVELRRSYWTKLFGYWPFVGGFLDRVSTWAGDHRARARGIAPEPARRAWMAWKKRQTKTSEAALEEALVKLATALADADASTELADQLTADVEALASGHGKGVQLGVRAPRRDSEPFQDYVRALQRSRLALLQARRDFAQANLRLVVTMAHRYRQNGRMSLGDLIQEGNLGLMTAIDRFDPQRGFRFSTYGTWWIRHAMSRALSDRGRVVRVPVHTIELQSKLRKARRSFEHEHGREPDDDELAVLTGVAKAKLERLGRVLLEQDEPSANEPNMGLGSARVQGMDAFVHPVDAVDTTLDRAHAQEVLSEALEELRPMEADILRMRFGFDRPAMTLREIGEVYSLSRERIRQMQERALSKLREALARSGVQEPPDEAELALGETP